ncbi:MAG: sigma-54-dependent transcriptional regulator, partial [Gammaproteobacteria bacterium]
MEYFPDAAQLGQTLIKPHILIVEDEELFAKAISKRLARAGYDSQLAPDLASARRAVEARIPDLVLLDMRLPDGSGLDLLSDLRERYSALISVLMFSAYAELEDAVAAMKLKAEDYLKKPIDLDELLAAVERILNKKKLAQQLEYSRTREQHAVSEVELLGEAPEMAQIRAQINRIAALCGSVQAIPPTVLVLGETGTGKDVVARLLHRASGRAGRPFVQVDCAALPRDLIEAELFGHEKGAFTHAHSARTGLIEAAEDGVLFLDEIVELPLELQAKLLAVLERRSVRALGSNRERPVA